MHLWVHLAVFVTCAVGLSHGVYIARPAEPGHAPADYTYQSPSHRAVQLQRRPEPHIDQTYGIEQSHKAYQEERPVSLESQKQTIQAYAHKYSVNQPDISRQYNHELSMNAAAKIKPHISRQYNHEHSMNAAAKIKPHISRFYNHEYSVETPPRSKPDISRQYNHDYSMNTAAKSKSDNSRGYNHEYSVETPERNTPDISSGYNHKYSVNTPLRSKLDILRHYNNEYSVHSPARDKPYISRGYNHGYDVNTAAKIKPEIPAQYNHQYSANVPATAVHYAHEPVLKTSKISGQAHGFPFNYRGFPYNYFGFPYGNKYKFGYQAEVFPLKDHNGKSNLHHCNIITSDLNMLLY